MNGIDISVSANDTFMTNNPEYMMATKTFNQTLTVRGDVAVGGLVDGVDIGQEAVTLDTDQVISGGKIFEDMVVIRGSLDVTGIECLFL